MTIRFFGYDKCDTCRKALKFLKSRDLDPEVIDITQTPPPLAQLKQAAKQVGVRKLFNTSGLVYREMKLGEKLPEMPDSEALKLLASNGRLVKRPFVQTGSTILVGFVEKDWEAAF